MTGCLVLLVGISAGLLLCLIVVLWRNRKNKRRLDETERLLQETRQHEASACSALMSERDDALQKLDALNNTSRDLFFIRLLGGNYQEEESLREDGRQVDVIFPNSFFLVMIARPEAWGEPFQEGSRRRDLNFILRNVLQDSFPGVTQAAEVGGDIVAILNLETMPDTALTEVVQDARRALEVLEAEFSLTVTITVSRVYQDVLALHAAYDDALRILEFQQILEEDRPITTYSELTYQQMGQPKTSYLELEQELLRCMRESDISGIQLSLRKMISVGFGVSEMSVDTIRFRVYGIVNILLCLADDLREFIGYETIEAIDLGPRLTSSQSLREIVNVLDDFLAVLEEKTAGSGSASWVEEIPRYIEENFRNPDLNVSSVADHFGVTPTYCSKLFKERYARRLHDDIQISRIRAAKALLQSDRSLDQVAEEVGFSNTLAMSRAFKKHEGATPGRYREDNLRI